MKKAIILISILVLNLALLSFKNIDNRSVTIKTNDKINVEKVANGYKYYTSITAWKSATESDTYYIFYTEGNGVRDYVVSTSRSINDNFFCYIIYDNDYYQDSSSSYSRYQYYFNGPGGFHYYFNCKLPYRK